MDQIRVLIVDDNEMVLQFASHSLISIADIEVVGTAKNGLESINLTTRLNPDVILMDIDMPVLSGVEATRIIKKQHPHIKVIMYSSHYRDQEKVLRSGNLGADDFLAKPADALGLAKTIRNTFWNKSTQNSERSVLAS